MTTNHPATLEKPVSDALSLFGILGAIRRNGLAKLTPREHLPRNQELERRLMRLVGTSDSGDLAEVVALIDAGVDPMTPLVSHFGTDQAFAPIHRAIAREDEACAKTLVNAMNSFDLNVQEGEFGDSPLMMAVKTAQHEVAQALIARGASLATPDRKGVTPFMEMCRRGQLELVEASLAQLTKYGRTAAVLHQTDSSGMNSLFHVICGGASLETKKMLISMHDGCGFDVNGKYGPEGYAPVHMASLVGNAHLIQLLADVYEADLNSISTEEKITPLMAAAWTNQPDSIKTLCTYPQVHIDGASAKDASTALHMAAARGHVEACTALVEGGASLKARNEQHQTPAELAQYVGQRQTPKLLRALDATNQAKTGLMSWLKATTTKTRTTGLAPRP